MAKSIELMLKAENMYVYKTDFGEEGVDLGKIYDYDIILLDLTLPDISGKAYPSGSGPTMGSDKGGRLGT